MSGKRKSVYAKDLSELRKQEKKINRDLEDNIDIEGSEITLNEQFDKYISLKRNLKKYTKQNYIDLWNCRIRNDVLGNKKLRDIKKSDILRFYNGLLSEELKYSTIKYYN